MKIRVLSIVLVVFMLGAFLCSCGGPEKPLSGTYISEDGAYKITFEADGSCRWYQSTTLGTTFTSFFEGTYTYDDSAWQLEIEGDAIHPNTVFVATASGNDLIITGGLCNNTLFIKQ